MKIHHLVILAAAALTATSAAFADKQANIADAFRLSARIADDVTAAAWANDVENANTAYQRVKLALGIAQRCLPKEIVDAPAGPVRFAKKERHDSAEKAPSAAKK